MTTPATPATFRWDYSGDEPPRSLGCADVDDDERGQLQASTASSRCSPGCAGCMCGACNPAPAVAKAIQESKAARVAKARQLRSMLLGPDVIHHDQRNLRVLVRLPDGTEEWWTETKYHIHSPYPVRWNAPLTVRTP